MSEEMSPIPRPVLIATGALLASSLVLAGVGSYTGIGRVGTPDADPVRSVALRFTDADDGGVIVRRADDDVQIAKLAPGTNGFIRGVMRSLVRARRLDRIQTDPPFQLTQWSDHRLTIEDPATGESVDVTGFGQDNRAAFARLLAVNATMRTGGSTHAE